MSLQVNDAVVVGPTNGFGELWVLGDNGANAGIRTNRGGIVVRDVDPWTPLDYSNGDFNPERIQLDDVLADTPDAHVRDRIPGPTVGVLSYDFSNFELLPFTPAVVVSGGLQREVTQAPGHKELSVATFNVENLDPSDGPAIARLAAIVVQNLRSPDLIGIEEMQDNNGAVNDGTTDATLSWQAFIAAIAAAGGPVYDYRQIDPENNADGGQPGGNIRVGFLFRTDRGLRFVDRGEGDATTPTGVFRSRGDAHLTLSPGRVDPLNPAWEATRKPLAGEFTWNGKTVIAIVNHFSSKGGDDPLFGRWQPPVRSTEEARHAQAASVNAFVDQIMAADRGAHVVVLGDINDFEFSETTRILQGRELISLLHLLPKAERYSYVFEGNSQVLDQILVSWPTLLHLRGFDVVHVNAEFFDQASDHDPSVARIKLGDSGRGNDDDDDDDD
jgi:predicted extracellular nuclease